MRVVYCFAAMLSFFTAYSQYEFAPIGAKWFQNIGISIDDGDSPLEDFYVLESTKDTIIEDNVFRLVNNYPFYQEGFKVYLWYGDSLNLIYNFELEVGDTITYQLFLCDLEIHNVGFSVTEKSILNINGQDLIKLIHKPLHSDYEGDYEILELIGSVRSALIKLDFCASVPGYIDEWLRCYSDDNISYKTARFESHNQDECEYRGINTIKYVTDNNYIVYPNPATDFVYFIHKDNSFSYRECEYEIVNLAGKKLLHRYNFNNVIDISTLNTGVYFLKIYKDENYYFSKIVKR